jgi:hypothetical protein
MAKIVIYAVVVFSNELDEIINWLNAMELRVNTVKLVIFLTQI